MDKMSLEGERSDFRTRARNFIDTSPPIDLISFCELSGVTFQKLEAWADGKEEPTKKEIDWVSSWF